MSTKSLLWPSLMVIIPPLMLLSFNNAENGRLHYEVIRNGDVIGDLYPTKTFNNGSFDYCTESTVNIKILVTFSIYSKVTGAFRNGVLVNGSALRSVNGKARVNTSILWSVNRYVIQEVDVLEEVKENITYTTARFFHDEPAGVKVLFSENYRKFISLMEIRPHYYELELPDGNSNFYSYSNGICTGAEVNTNLSKVFFRLKK